MWRVTFYSYTYSGLCFQTQRTLLLKGVSNKAKIYSHSKKCVSSFGLVLNMSSNTLFQLCPVRHICAYIFGGVGHTTNRLHKKKHSVLIDFDSVLDAALSLSLSLLQPVYVATDFILAFEAPKRRLCSDASLCA